MDLMQFVKDHIILGNENDMVKDDIHVDDSEISFVDDFMNPGSDDNHYMRSADGSVINKEFVYGLYQEAMLKNEYTDELVSSNTMRSSRDALYYMDGYVDNIIEILAKILPKEKNNIEEEITSLIEAYNESCIITDISEYPKFTIGNLYKMNRETNEIRLIIDVQIISNRNGQKKISLSYISSSANNPFFKPTKEQIYTIKYNNEDIKLDLDSFNCMTVRTDNNGTAESFIEKYWYGKISDETLEKVNEARNKFDLFKSKLYNL